MSTGLPPMTAIRVATAADAAPIRALLEASGLPSGDLDRSRPEFLVACEGERVIGAGGLERCGTSGLLRSVAVTESWRNSGVGRALVARLEQRARELALGELVLLTQTARRFFEREGYRLIERAAAPQAVQASEEFRLLCPKSAVCMLKRLV